MVKYIELMEASRHCDLCYKSNHSDLVDAQSDNGYHKDRAQNYLERAILKSLPERLDTSDIGRISSNCDKCHDNGFESKGIILGLESYL